MISVISPLAGTQAGTHLSKAPLRHEVGERASMRVCVPVGGGQPRTAGTGGGGGGGWTASVCCGAGGGDEEHPATSAAGITRATSARRAIFSATSDIRTSIVAPLQANTTIRA